MGLCMITLQHEVMVADEWQDDGTEDPITITWHIHNAVNKEQLCLLSEV